MTGISVILNVSDYPWECKSKAQGGPHLRRRLREKTKMAVRAVLELTKCTRTSTAIHPGKCRN